MMSSYLTAFGAIIVSIGGLFVTASQNELGSVIAVLGLVVVIVGLVVVRREMRQQQKEHNLRVRREKASIIILTHIAKGLKIDMNEIAETLRDKLNE